MLEYVREEWGRLYSFHLYRDKDVWENWYWSYTKDTDHLIGPYISEWEAIDAFKRTCYD